MNSSGLSVIVLQVEVVAQAVLPKEVRDLVSVTAAVGD
jgi:hypothetical protein